MSMIKSLLKDVVKKSGFSIKRLRPSVEGSYSDLYSFFAANSDEAEIFMKYIYSLIVKEGDWVMDVGANHGLHTGPLSRLVGDKGKVIAFEAISGHLPDIEHSSVIANIDLINKAVTNPDIAQQKKQVQFTYYPKQDGYSGMKSRSDINDIGQEITVPTTTIDQAFSKFKPQSFTQLSFIKIDIEGADFDALKGAQKLLKQYKPVVIMENRRQAAAEQYGYTKSEYYSYLEGLGYQLVQFTGKPFTQSDWDKSDIYWETWLIHKQSPYLDFFTNHYRNLALAFMEDKALTK